MLARFVRWWARPVAGVPTGDLVIAGALMAIAVASVLTGNPYEGPTIITLPAALVGTGSLVWRTRQPAITVVGVLAAGIFQSILAGGQSSLWSLVVLVISMYSCAAYYREGMAAACGVVLVGALLIEERVDNGVDYLFIVLLFGGAWLLGRASRLWRTRVRHVEQHQEQLARLAVAEERVRIARDLHDIIAHSLSVITVQADAAEAALDHDPELAREPLTAITATARASINEIREVVQVLRSDEVEPSRTPSMSAAPERIADARRAGADLEVSLADTRGLPTVIDAAGYRILQEALTNVVRHARGTWARVVVARDTDALDIEVANGPGAPSQRGGGMGLLGMRERVLAVGGTFEAGATGDGGFRLHARLPLRPGPAESNGDRA
jgi:signal transduction histidine kinase